MIRCKNCGAFVSTANRLMSTCGTLIYSPTGYIVYCRRCGTPNPCTAEGTEIEEEDF